MGGVLERSVTTRETEWDDTEYGWMRALADYEAGLCNGCGHPLDETTDIGSDASNRQGVRRYVPQILRCHACTEVARSLKAQTSSGPDGSIGSPFPEALKVFSHPEPR